MTEDRLREAIRTRTGEVVPSPPPESLRRIEQRLEAARRATVRRRLIVGLASAAAVLAVVAVAVSVAGPGDEGNEVQTADRDRTTTTAPSTTEPSTTTATTEPSSSASTSTSSTSSSSTTTTAAPPPPSGTAVDPSVPVWPSTQGSQRFDDPVDAARSFAVDLVGFRDPLVGSFEPDGEGSGSVAIRAASQGPASTAQVRRLDDGTWWVVGSSTVNITLDEPATGAPITCPLRLTGSALAFEGTVNVSLRDDGGTELGNGIVTGGGDVARPFDGTVDCSVGGAGGVRYGTVILVEHSAEDGRVLAAVARRVAL